MRSNGRENATRDEGEKEGHGTLMSSTLRFNRWSPPIHRSASSRNVMLASELTWFTVTSTPMLLTTQCATFFRPLTSSMFRIVIVLYVDRSSSLSEISSHKALKIDPRMLRNSSLLGSSSSVNKTKSTSLSGKYVFNAELPTPNTFTHGNLRRMTSTANSCISLRRLFDTSVGAKLRSSSSHSA